MWAGRPIHYRGWVTRQRRRGGYAVGRARREQILDSAIEHFASAGYHRTSINQIARDVGLTGPGLMHHFPTKQHLLLAVADRRFDLLHHWAQDAAPDEDGTGVLRNLLRMSRLLVGQPGLIELFVLVSAEAADPASPTHVLFKERYERVIAQLARDFQDSVAKGHLRPDLNYDDIARDCIAITDGLQLQWVLAEGQLDLVARVRDHLERLAPAILRSGQQIELDATSALVRSTV